MNITKDSLKLFALIGFTWMAACGGNPSNAPTELTNVRQPVVPIDESQCGPAWDVQNVESYDGTLGVSQTVVARHQLHVGYHVGHCTGTLISDDLFLSAGHCGYSVGDTVRFNYQNAPDGTPRPTQDYSVAAIVEQEYTATLDYAIVRLNGLPGREFGHATIAATDPPVGSLLTIIQHPGGNPKGIHAGPVLDYPGGNWLRHQVDTTGGSSGSGVLNTAGQLVAVHTNAGCAQNPPIEGNSAIRMSQLVANSPTLQALTQSKIVWKDTNGKISIWNVDGAGNYLSNIDHGPYAGWTPVNYANNRILWNHTTGQISLWRVDSVGNFLGTIDHGPFAGWTAVNYASNRILWRHTSGQISIWNVDDNGAFLGYTDHGPFADWTALNYANNRVLWRHVSGKLSLWVLDDNNNLVSAIEHGPFGGWTPVEYANNEILWKHDNGSISQWTVARDGARLGTSVAGPYAGWTAVSHADRHVLWAHTTGKASFWTTDGEGNMLSYADHGPYAGWSPFLTATGLP